MSGDAYISRQEIHAFRMSVSICNIAGSVGLRMIVCLHCIPPDMALAKEGRRFSNAVNYHEVHG